MAAFVKLQEQAKRLSESPYFQHFIALLIVINFVINVIQTETLPPDGSYEFRLFNGLDLAFTLVSPLLAILLAGRSFVLTPPLQVFALELAINVIAAFFRPFLTNRWLQFDFCVVVGTSNPTPSPPPRNASNSTRVIRRAAQSRSRANSTPRGPA
jgi:hypothetical protein